jgi:alanine racemase
MLCLAVKADGYGHGAAKISLTAVEESVEWLAVATLDEAAELRTAGLRSPILLLSLPLPDEIEDLIRLGVSITYADRGLLQEIRKAAVHLNISARVHLAVDTGMGRIGCTPVLAPLLASEAMNNREVIFEGVFTHFPEADGPERSFTENQVLTFNHAVSEMQNIGIYPPIRHAANSAAVLGHKDSHMDMTRPGIAAYGYGIDANPESPRMKPVMEFRSKIMFLKRVPKGTPISYGRTYLTTTDTVVATVGAGYADGYSRLLSGKAEVMIGGKRYPVAGRICMDQFMVDLGPNPKVNLYDDVVLFGPNPDGPDAQELADIIGTISYEVLCNVGKRVRRIYTDTD